MEAFDYRSSSTLSHPDVEFNEKKLSALSYVKFCCLLRSFESPTLF